jgi:hypothetical protein
MEDSEQATAPPRPLTNDNICEPVKGAIGIKDERQVWQIQLSRMAVQQPTLRIHDKVGKSTLRLRIQYYAATMVTPATGLKEYHGKNLIVRETSHEKQKTPPLAVKRNGGAGTEKRPNHLTR